MGEGEGSKKKERAADMDREKGRLPPSNTNELPLAVVPAQCHPKASPAAGKSGPTVLHCVPTILQDLRSSPHKKVRSSQVSLQSRGGYLTARRMHSANTSHQSSLGCDFEDAPRGEVPSSCNSRLRS